MADMQLWALYYIVGLSLVTFLVFGWDKRKAKKASPQRTPEATLLGLCFLGGVIGGWFGMSFFRHKTKKLSFKVKMVLVSILNPMWLAVWFWADEIF